MDRRRPGHLTALRKRGRRVCFPSGFRSPKLQTISDRLLPRSAARTNALALGLAYGVVWWILGALLVMPTWLGMGPQVAQAFTNANDCTG